MDIEIPTTTTEDVPLPFRGRIVVWIIVVLIVVGMSLFAVEAMAPATFVPNTLVHVSSSSSLTSAGKLLQSQNVIKSTFMFRLAVSLVGGTHSVNMGDYFFPTPLSVWQVAYRVTHDDQGFKPIKVTFPEGTSVRGMGEILGKVFSAVSSTTATSGGTFSFDVKKFAMLASTSEGYLFPDTYFFAPNATPDVVIATLRDTFDKKILSIMPQITVSGRSVHDVVIMASIVEKEALDDTDRRIIAGILWKRLDSGYPLQIDPPFAYALGKTSDELTLADLQIDSPYNTYKNKGLPPTPINNPGLETLTAVVNASSTPYWYYLSDSKGVLHYAATYEGHLTNRAKYLGK